MPRGQSEGNDAIDLLPGAAAHGRPVRMFPTRCCPMRGLGVRLAFMLSVTLLLLMGVATWWVQRELTAVIHDEEVRQAEVHAKTLLASLQTLMLNGQGTLAREWLDRMRDSEGIVDIQVLRTNGDEAFTDLTTVDAVNQFLQVPRFTREPAPVRSLQPESNLFQQAIKGDTAFDLSRAEEITVLMPIPTGTECLGCHGYDSSTMRGVLQLSLSAEKRERRIAQMRTAIEIGSVLLVTVLGVVMFAVLRLSVVRPISLLAHAIARVGEGARDVSLPTEWKDELGDVAKVFNRMQHLLRTSEARMRSVMDSVLEAVITIDERGTIESVNPPTEEIFGYTAAELIGRNVSLLMPEPYRSKHDHYLAHYLSTGKGNIIGRRGVELLGQRKNGETFSIELGLSEMCLDERRYFVGVIRDITERKRQSAAIEYQALHDALTDLPNRTLLTDRLRQAILRAQRTSIQFAFLLMDLDHFKQINDTLGHQYGDMILKEVAQRVRDSLRETDTVARLGGDEFAVVLATSERVHATQVATKILRSLEEPFIIEGQSLHVGASIGIALYPEHGTDEMTLMRLADVAMYVAKRKTRGVAIYDASTDEHNPRNLALLGELRRAIDANELVLFYQPKIDLRTRRVTGVEALVRWQHPKHGLMFPDEFVPLAEQTGLIKPLTLWVLKHALRQVSEWRSQGFELDVAVNLSVRNLQDAQFPERVADLLASSIRPLRNLWLEITETAIMADPERAQAVLRDLRDMDVMLSIDDFGKGYSSLAYLKQLPVREIKIDRSFVSAMLISENDAVIVRSIMDLAHNIGLHAIAEGVEDAATCERLIALGCDLAQGYYFSKPVPPREFEIWLRESSWGLRNTTE